MTDHTEKPGRWAQALSDIGAELTETLGYRHNRFVKLIQLLEQTK